MADSNTLYPRHIVRQVSEAFQDTPVIFLGGPRQAGKTTLARQFRSPTTEYLTLDNDSTRLAAQQDPVGLIRGRDRVIIDEIQRAPELILAIKESVDNDRRPGRFLLTGSASLMVLPTLTDSLAGRMETFKLLPLSRSEICRSSANWIDKVFADSLPKITTPVLGADLVNIVLSGGFPEALSRELPQRRRAWARQYIDALVQRDIRDIAEVSSLSHIKTLLRALAYTATRSINYSNLGSALGLDHKTIARYLGILEQTYLVNRLEPYFTNKLSRLVKTPKVQFLDSGLLATILNASKDTFLEDRTAFGAILETFVYGELEKHLTWADTAYQLYFFRDHEGREVDFLIENSAGDLVAVEVKASATIRADDLRGLRYLQEHLGNRLRKAVILYDGTETLPVSPGITAVPLSSLWGD